MNDPKQQKDQQEAKDNPQDMFIFAPEEDMLENDYRSQVGAASLRVFLKRPGWKEENEEERK